MSLYVCRWLGRSCAKKGTTRRTLADARKVKELRAVVNFGPKAALQLLLRLAKLLGCLEPVQVRQNAHNLGETVRLQHVEKLERLHFKAKAAIDHEQDLADG